MTTQNLRLTVILSGSALLLLTPLIAMQFTTEVNWTLADFVVAGTLLLAVGLSIELILRKVNAPKNRIMILLVIMAFLLTWAELAVGVFGTPFAGS